MSGANVLLVLWTHSAMPVKDGAVVTTFIFYAVSTSSLLENHPSYPPSFTAAPYLSTTSGIRMTTRIKSA
jgi:hypothetical protein